MSQINGSKSFHLKAFEMRIRKLALGLSVAQILSEKINKRFIPKKALIH